MRSAIRLPLIAAVLLATGAARAQASDPAAAQAMFDEAKQLMAAGRLAEACPKFLVSFKLDPKPGAAVNLADCYEKNGQFASAWARYLEAASLAQRAAQPEREQYARDHAKALEPKLSRVSVNAAPAPGLEVLRDGVVIDPAMLGTALPVDAGKHQIDARAPGKKTWTTTVELPIGGAPVKVDVPPLQDGEAGASPVGPVAPGAPPAPGDAAPVPFWGSQRVAGLVVGVVGLAGLGVGSAFGAIASSKWSTAKTNDCGGTTMCSAAGVTLVGDAKSAATVSTGMFIAGGVLVAAGVVVFATAPRAKAPARAGLVLAPAPIAGGAAFIAKGEF
jgi:hypothetical protein